MVSLAQPASSKSFSQLFSSPDSDTVLNLSKTPVSLVSYVNEKSSQNKAVLLGWLRHYGCTLCKKQTADWAKLAPRLQQCGDVTLALIGNGSVDQAKDFVNEMGWKGDIFTDPSRRTYAALQFAAGVGVTFNLQALGKTIKSVWEGNSQTLSRIPTDAFQQGGAILVDPKGMITLFHRDAFAGDHVDIDELYETTCAVCQQPAAS